MPIQLSSFLIPAGGNSNFLLEDKYVRGGMRVVADVTARDAINGTCKKAGMLVWTQSEGKLWQLQSNLTTYAEFAASVNHFYTHTQTTPSDTWTVVHNKGSTDFVYNVYNDDDGVVVPNSVKALGLYTIQITFSVPVYGRATFSFNM